MRIVMMIVTLLWSVSATAAVVDWEGLDGDKSGSLEQREIEASAPKVFHKADQSGDKALSRHEFEAAGGKPIRFDALDQNQDGKIDLNEFSAAAIKRFRSLDKNGDGRIDLHEIRSRQTPIQNPILQFYF